MNEREQLRKALEDISAMTYDSWTNGARAKEIADAALTTPQADKVPAAEGASDDQLTEAYWQGWCEASDWAGRNDLYADRDSQGYVDAMLRRLGPIRGTTTPPARAVVELSDEVRYVLEQVCLATDEHDDLAQGTHYVGKDGRIRCKGSFLDTIERARSILAAATTAATGGKCPDGLTPDGPNCPRCGGKRGESGVDGGSWVHIGGTK